MRVYTVAFLGFVLVAAWLYLLRTDGDVSGLMSRTAIAATGDSLDRRARELAGWFSRDCGRLAPEATSKQLNECVQDAFASAKPFRVRYDIRGKDSVVSIALVRTKPGQLYTLIQDDMSSGTRWRQELTSRRCPEPTVLKQTALGRLTCFAADETPYR